MQSVQIKLPEQQPISKIFILVLNSIWDSMSYHLQGTHKAIREQVH